MLCLSKGTVVPMHAIMTYWGEEALLHPFLTSALDDTH
jgi:hypothetical protein